MAFEKDGELYISLREVVKKFRLNRAVLYKMVDSGDFPPAELKGHWRLSHIINFFWGKAYDNLDAKSEQK